MYVVYMLECNDGTLYTGITMDMARRFREHKAGTASKYTRSRGAKRVVYIENVPTHSAALKRELELKTFPREKKRTLINYEKRIKF